MSSRGIFDVMLQTVKLENFDAYAAENASANHQSALAYARTRGDCVYRVQ